MAERSPRKPGTPGPQPKGPFHGKRETLTTRITRNTKRRLGQEASASGRSLSQEIELRLETSFVRDDARIEALGGPENLAVMKVIATTLDAISATRGASWLKDDNAYLDAQKAVHLLLCAFRPRKSRGKTSAVLGDMTSSKAAEVLREFADVLDGKRQPDDTEQQAIEYVRSLLDAE